MKSFITPLVALILLVACGGDNTEKSEKSTQELSKSTSSKVTINNVNLEVPDNSSSQKYHVALIGNSHASGLLSKLGLTLQHFSADAEVRVRVLGFGFTDELISNESTLSEFEKGAWTHLIIQGQKYSQSRAVKYPSGATEQWIHLAKQKGVTPILFPEHPQFADPQEGEYTYNLHQEITEKQASCLAPVGPAWINALKQLQGVPLHQPDGNHASPEGLLLSSLIFTQIITGEVVDSGPFQVDSNIPVKTHENLAQIASQALLDYPACNHK